MSNAARVSAEEARRALEDQPLVGLTRAAAIVGVQRPNMRKLAQRRLPPPIAVEGSASVYLKSEVEALAAELRREREERAQRGAA